MAFGESINRSNEGFKQVKRKKKEKNKEQAWWVESSVDSSSQEEERSGFFGNIKRKISIRGESELPFLPNQKQYKKNPSPEKAIVKIT
jgi:hypothetical protein